MAWIRTVAPSSHHSDLLEAMRRAMAGYPGEYGPEREGEMRLPPLVRDESIVRAHCLIPGALEHFFAGLGALLSPDLPLSRRQHEMIAATVSSLNRCFY